MSARWRRAKFWLGTCVALHLALAAFAVGATVWRYRQGVEGLPDFGSKALGAGVYELAFPAVLAVLSLVVGVWLVRKPQLTRSPDSWIAIPLATGVLMAAGVGGAMVHVMSESAGNVNFVLIPGVIAFAMLPVYLAFRALLRPLVAELGDSTVPVILQVRAASKKWWYQDSIRVDTESVRLAVRSGDGRPTWGESTKETPLRDVAAVGARSATGDEPPWAWLSDGRGLSVPPGEALVVVTATDEQLVPVHDAEVLAELLRRRVRLVTGRMPSTLDTDGAASPNPGPATEPAEPADSGTEKAAGHVPEVLPAPPRTGQRVTATSSGTVPPAGPGMVFRGVLSTLLGGFGVIVAPVVGVLLTRSRAVVDPEAPWLSEWVAGFGALWLTIGFLLWVVSIRVPRRWPWIGLISSVPVALAAWFSEDGLVNDAGTVIVVVALVATVLARLVWTRRLGTDLAASASEVPVRLNGQGIGRLLIQRDRIVFDRRKTGAGGHVRHALALADLTLAQPGETAGAEVPTWPLPGGSMLRLRRGPALRLVAGSQQWIVPVLQPDLIAEIVRGRAARARPLGYRAPTVEEWHRLRRWSVSATTAARGRGLGTAQAIGNRLLLIAMFPAVFGTMLLTVVFGRGLTGIGTELFVIIVALLLAVALVVIWYRRRSALILAEDNQLPPGSPSWGDPRPDRAPIPAWRPWSAPTASSEARVLTAK
ncbi:hypothetical protein GIY23_08140 [Allosaccharopolyspora coralli]|uniref:Uncharacterized protein n=1 Tax=Allosaccharopolyspora coralli TaxID=2665642 RepID=A0A5Q3Q7T1_9PSEU|nr:hypothetical protein GIY23_08140 [Allosaccharopolyspora coralli]